jgi:hypothetical protein
MASPARFAIRRRSRAFDGEEARSSSRLATDAPSDNLCPGAHSLSFFRMDS